jgi:uncharacterized protein YfdQ (DUF2303 family)
MDADTIQKIVDTTRTPHIVDVGMEGQVPEKKFGIIPEGMKVEDLSKFLPPPDRIKQRVELLNVPSYVEYVNRFKSDESTIFANEPTAQYETVLDYHGSENAGGRGTQDHLAVYNCPKSEQWKAWTEKDGQWFEQVAFAAFLETNLKEIVSPPGAVFMEVALQLQIHKSAEFQSEVRLDNGQVNFRYEEVVKGQTKAGDLLIPQSFTLKMPVFVDGSPQALEARFRYRMEEGKLKMGYQLIRPLEVWNAAVKVVTDEIRKGAPDVKLYAGRRF